MDNLDLKTLALARQWMLEGRQAWLVTVLETWGSAPRPPGALMCLAENGEVLGSVSGGCVEDDLVDRVRRGERVDRPSLMTYGVTKDEAARFGLPCGGTLRLLHEPLSNAGWMSELAQRTAAGELVSRHLDLDVGRSRILTRGSKDRFFFDGRLLVQPFGPRWRLLVIGAGDLSCLVAQMAMGLDFAVTCCDPREEYGARWEVGGVDLNRSMPDDLVLELGLDAHSAVVALSHDPKIDDMALMEALLTPAFYVGALGSRSNTQRRKERLALLGLQPSEIDRLHGPIGLDIGARSPAEIAISVLAEIVAVRNGVALVQKKPGSSVPGSPPVRAPADLGLA